MFQHLWSLPSFVSPFQLPAAATEALHPPMTASEASVVLSLVGILLLFILAVVTLVVAGTWKTYVKAGQPGWAAIIPVYSGVKLLQMVNAPLWWIILLCIPGVNLIFSVIVTHRLAVVFGRGWGFTIGLICLPFIFYPILGFGRASYVNTYPPAPPMSEAAKWTLVGAFVIVFFQIYLGSKFSSDSRHALTVYSGGDVGAGGYATDGERVYYEDQIVSGADTKSFELQGVYGLDRSAVYHRGSILLNSHRESFHVLNGGVYAQDSTGVYYDGMPLTLADPESFTVLSVDLGYSKDARRVYINNNEVVGADLQTFLVVTGKTSKGVSYDAQDKNHYYSQGWLLE